MPRKPAKARIFLVDDHPLVRKGVADCLREEPDLVVCGEAGTAQQALVGIERERPDLVLVDIAIPGRDGIELIKDIKAHHCRLLILVLSMYDESLYAERALRAGACGYVMKSAPTDELIHAIRQVLAGEIAVGRQIISRVLARITASPRHATGTSPLECLTDRELEIFRLLGQGRQRAEIAAQLRLSVKTIESHRAKIRQKLGIRSATQLRQHATQFLHEEAHRRRGV